MDSDRQMWQAFRHNTEFPARRHRAIARVPARTVGAAEGGEVLSDRGTGAHDRGADYRPNRRRPYL